MKLLRLSVRNFKGIADFTLEPGHSVTTIRATNGAGKTSVHDAFAWLLTGADAQGRVDFAIKPHDAEGNEVPNLTTSVEAMFFDVTLRREYHEVYTRKRGSASETFTGHTTEYFVDEVPVQKKEFDARVAALAPAKAWAYLTSPTAFALAPWREQRSVLIDIAGDVKPEDVLRAGDFRDIAGDVLARGIDDTVKIIDASTKKLNERLRALPAVIDEAARAAEEPEVPEIPREVAAGMLHAAQAEIDALRDGDVSMVMRRQIAERTDRIDALRRAERARVADETARLNGESRDLLSAINANLDEQTRAADDAERAQASLVSVERAKARLIEEYDAIRAERFEFDEMGVCPSCGQILPDAQVDAAREKALAAFNDSRSRREEDCRYRAGTIKADAAALTARIAAAEARLPGLKERFAELSQKRAEVNAAAAAVEFTPEIAAEIASLEAEVAEIEAGVAADAPEDLSALHAAEAAVEAWRFYDAATAQRDRQLARVAELQDEQRTAAAEYERQLARRMSCEDYIRARVRYLDERVNAHFSRVRFKLFAEQINGGLAETCVAMVNTNGCYVEFPYANTAGQITAGLDIIETLSRHYGVHPPVIIDQAGEVVTAWPATNGAQQIRMYADDTYPTLTAF